MGIRTDLAMEAKALWEKSAGKTTKLAGVRARERERDTTSEIYRKKQLWHDWRVAIISAAVGVILTLMVQHFSDIINFFKVLLQ